jgi:hypothetical protein
MSRKGDLLDNEPFAAVFAHENVNSPAWWSILLIYKEVLQVYRSVLLAYIVAL